MVTVVGIDHGFIVDVFIKSKYPIEIFDSAYDYPFN
jgi:hypothetical protein